MSIKLIHNVWEDTRTTDHTELLVMLALADFSNDEGRCYPSMRTIARKARIEDRSVRRIIGRLIQTGRLKKVEQGGTFNGKTISNEHQIRLPVFPDYSSPGDCKSVCNPPDSKPLGDHRPPALPPDHKSPPDPGDTYPLTRGPPNRHITVNKKILAVQPSNQNSGSSNICFVQAETDNTPSSVS